MPDVERVRQVFNYDHQSGQLTYRIRRGYRKHPGDKAGWVNRRGYISVALDGETHLAHRIIWLHVHGVEPMMIDHIDGNPSNNSLSNLRECSSQNENMQNLLRRPRDLPIGVFKRNSKYEAKIMSDGKIFYLGVFDMPDEAGRAYLEAKALLHKFNPIPRSAQGNSA